MSYKHEDVIRSLLWHFDPKNSTEFAGENVILDAFEEDTSALDRWYRVNILSLYPDSTRMGDQVERGTIRVYCHSRKPPIEPGKSANITIPQAMADKVKSALRGADIEVRDWTANGGTSVTGFIHADEVQVDDIGESEDHVRILICTTRILVNAA